MAEFQGGYIREVEVEILCDCGRNFNEVHNIYGDSPEISHYRADASFVVECPSCGVPIEVSLVFNGSRGYAEALE